MADPKKDVVELVILDGEVHDGERVYRLGDPITVPVAEARRLLDAGVCGVPEVREPQAPEGEGA